MPKGKRSRVPKGTSSATTDVVPFDAKEHDPGASRRTELTRKTLKASRHQLITIGRRVLILVAALYYVTISIQCCISAMSVLVGTREPSIPSLPYTNPLVLTAVGNATVYESFLVQTLLGGDTTPHPHTLYLSAEYDVVRLTTDGCPTRTAVDGVYADVFLRTMFTSLVHGASYNLTFLDPASTELIAPLADCQSDARLLEDFTAGRFFFLVRATNDPTMVSLLVINLSNQGYQALARNEMGSTSFMTIALLTDMSMDTVDHHFVLSLGYPFQQFDMVVYEYLARTEDNYWKLRSLPRDPTTESPRTILTACRSGFYLDSESTQSIFLNTIWDLPTNPQQVALIMPWRIVPVVHDSWAWVHLVHGFLAWGVLFQVLVLFVITLRNLTAQKIWLGDAFVGISTSLELRGLIVIASMVMNKFWAIREFCLREVMLVSGGNNVQQEPITHIDLLAIYLSLVGLLGKLLRVRVDPALSVGMFELGFRLHSRIRAWSPSISAYVAQVGLQDFSAGIMTSDDETSTISPMLLWGPHKMIPLSFSFFLGMLFPILLTLIPLTLWTLGRKAIHRWYPSSSSSVRSDVSQVAPLSSRSDASDFELPSVSYLRTNFELATGAHLADQYGLVGDYDNYMYIKGLRFASADGIYNNGFVIVNHKFLVQTNDLMSIAMMRFFRVRFRNVYAYEVNEHSVEEMARLVYPDTMTFTDLLCIDISVLT